MRRRWHWTVDRGDGTGIGGFTWTRWGARRSAHQVWRLVCGGGFVFATTRVARVRRFQRKVRAA